MSARWKVSLGVLGLIIIVFFAVNFVRHGPPSGRERATPSSAPTTRGVTAAKASTSFIVANPLDLTQIHSLSKFRSCAGHNFSGLNVDGQEETYRSMKHYIEPVPTLAQTAKRVKIFAPFNGTITELSRESRGGQVRITPTAAPSWQFIFFHVDLVPAVDRKGAAVTAGQHIGYGNLTAGANFDMGLRSYPQDYTFASPFSYMSGDILRQYAAVGITPANIITSKAARDAQPCPLEPGQSGRDARFLPGQRPSDWVELRR